MTLIATDRTESTQSALLAALIAARCPFQAHGARLHEMAGYAALMGFMSGLVDDTADARFTVALPLIPDGVDAWVYFCDDETISEETYRAGWSAHSWNRATLVSHPALCA